jgi:hypothetical protein
VRMQQRGIDSEVLDHLFAYGRNHAHTVRVRRRFKQQLAGD